MLVVAVTHDLNLALQFSDRVLLLDQGNVRGDGPPGKVLNPVLIGEVFGVRANLLSGPQGRQFVTYDA
jgi:iron complex transport system ATP-binding protein